MYGGSTGGGLYGNYTQFGSPFRIEATNRENGWVVPETSLSWNIRNGIVLTGSYSGRFSDDYSENTGSVALNLYW